jgi:hypothetical protein
MKTNLVMESIALGSLILSACTVTPPSPMPTLTPPPTAVDPASCRPFAGLGSAEAPPSNLYGHSVVRGTSITVGSFTFDYWLYCDPAYIPGDPTHFSAVAGLAMYAAWHYMGPKVEGAGHDAWGFEPNVGSGSGWEGPMYKASSEFASGIALFGDSLQPHLKDGSPIRFRVSVESLHGKTGAVFSFSLKPTAAGYAPIGLVGEPLQP